MGFGDLFVWPLPDLPVRPTDGRRQLRGLPNVSVLLGQWFDDQPVLRIGQHAGRCVACELSGLLGRDSEVSTHRLRGGRRQRAGGRDPVLRRLSGLLGQQFGYEGVLWVRQRAGRCPACELSGVRQ